MKYLFNPATDNFESLEPTLKDRFNLKDQMADAASATEMAIDESLKAFKTYQDAGGTMSYKDFIASGNEGVSKFFKDGGRVPQLVQPGPGRQGYKGTPVISSILEELKGTKSTPVDLEAILKKYEITARSSKKNIKDRLIKEGYKIKKYPVSRQVENVIKELAKYESSVDREKLQNLYELILDANNTDTGLLIKHDKKLADKSASVLMKEAGFGKTMKPGANRFAEKLIDRHLVSTKNKMRAAFKNMLSNENAAFDGLTKPIEQIAKRFGVKDNVVRTALQDFPFYKQNKAMITRLGHADFIKKWKGQDLLLGEVAELAELKPLRPYFNRGPEGLIQQMAYRHFKAGGDKINFLTHPDQYDPKDWKFEYKGKTYDYLDLARTRDDPNFKSVWKAIDDVKNYEEFKITDPKILEEFGYKKPTKLGTIMRRAYGVGTGKKGYFYSRVKDIDHFGNILEEPFENLRALDARTNRAAGHIDLHLSGDEAIKAKKKIGYFNQIDYNDVDAFNQMVDRDLQLARDILIPSKRYPTGRKLRTGYNIGKEYAQRKGPMLGSTFANVDREMLDFRKLPDDVRHFADIAAKYGAKSPALLNALKKAKAAGKFTGLALATEPLFVAPFVGYQYLAGDTPERMWGDATLGLVGQTGEEEIRKATGERGYATQQISELGPQLEALQTKYESLGDTPEHSAKRQEIENKYKWLSNKYNKAYNMFVDDTGQFNKDLYNQALNNYTAGIVQIDKFKKQLAGEREEDRIKTAEKYILPEGYDPLNPITDDVIRNIKGFAGGGIASLTRTTPPTRGPQYRGLDYLKYYGR